MSRMLRCLALGGICALPLPAIAAKNVPPSVSLTAPASGSNFSAPASITLAATASDPDGGIAKVEFYRGGTTLIATTTTAPYSAVWSNIPAGSYSLTAKATDSRGAATTSAPVIVTVTAVANTPPSVVLTAPAPGTRYSAPAAVTLSAGATDPDDAISTVEFFQGSVRLGTATAEPYTVTWTDVPTGNYTLTARATDARGAATTSAPVSIVVGPPNQPPLVAITAPAVCGSFDAGTGIGLTAEAVDPDGEVVSVDFYAGGTLVGSVPNSSPHLDAQYYSYHWSGMAPGTYTIIASAMDNLGTSAASAPITLTVAAANQPPQVVLTSPAGGAVFAASAPVTLTAEAGDSDGSVAKVDFYSLDSTGGRNWLGAASAPPYTVTWSGAKQPGQYSLAALATDNRGAQTQSASVPITVSANVPPTVSLTAPAAGSTFHAPATIPLAADAADSDGSVAKVEFYNGSTLLGAATSAPYAHTWTNAPAGSHTLTAKATDDLGASTVSPPVNVTVNTNASPSVSLSAPATGSTYYVPAAIYLAADPADSDGAIAKVEFYEGSTLIGSATSAPFTYTWVDVPAGSYTLTAKATDNLGAVTTSAPVILTVDPLQFTIASPADGSALAGNSALISGTFQAPPNTGITVNGVIAATDAGNHFYAEVPLDPGQNTITATLTTQAGQTATRSLTLTSDGVPPAVQIVADELEVIYPQQLSVRMNNSGNTVATVVQTNGGSSWTVPAGGTLTLTYTFPVPGTYPLSFTADVGAISKSYMIVVKSPAQVDALLRGVFAGMMDKLRIGDIEGAMYAVNGTAHDKYHDVFASLVPNLTTVVDQFGTMQPGTFSTTVAEYPLLRDTPGGKEVFTIDLFRGEDGVWRIDGM